MNGVRHKCAVVPGWRKSSRSKWMLALMIAHDSHFVDQTVFLTSPHPFRCLLHSNPDAESGKPGSYSGGVAIIKARSSAGLQKRLVGLRPSASLALSSVVPKILQQASRDPGKAWERALAMVQRQRPIATSINRTYVRIVWSNRALCAVTITQSSHKA